MMTQNLNQFLKLLLLVTLISQLSVTVSGAGGKPEKTISVPSDGSPTNAETGVSSGKDDGGKGLTDKGGNVPPGSSSTVDPSTVSPKTEPFHEEATTEPGLDLITALPNFVIKNNLDKIHNTLDTNNRKIQKSIETSQNGVDKMEQIDTKIGQLDEKLSREIEDIKTNQANKFKWITDNMKVLNQNIAELMKSIAGQQDAVFKYMMKLNMLDDAVKRLPARHAALTQRLGEMEKRESDDAAQLDGAILEQTASVSDHEYRLTRVEDNLDLNETSSPLFPIQEDDYLAEWFSSASRTAKFLNVTIECLASFLTRDEINVESEQEVLDAVLRWVRADEANRSSQLCALLKNVRLLQIPNLVSLRAETGQLTKDDAECQMLIVEAELAQNDPNYKPQLNIGQQLPAALTRRDARKLPAGKKIILAVGGKGQESEMFDPSKNVWKRVQGLDVPANESTYDITVLNGHQVYRCGRFSCEIYDSWTAKINKDVAPLLNPRLNSSLVTLNGSVYAVGGLRQDGSISSAVERYDPTANRWTEVKQLPVQIKNFAVASSGSNIYVVGGQNQAGQVSGATLMYDSFSDSWTQIDAVMTTPRYGHALVAVDGRLYAIGGSDASGRILKSIESFDTQSQVWEPLDACLIQARTGLSAAVLEVSFSSGNNVMILVGGGRVPGFVARNSFITPTTEMIEFEETSTPAGRKLRVSGVGGGRKMTSPRADFALLSVQVPKYAPNLWN